MLRKKKFSKPWCNMHARWAASEGNVYQYQKVPESTTRYQKVSERYRKGTRKFQKGTSSVRGRNAGAMLTSHSVRRRCAWAVSEGAAYLSNASEQQEGSAASLSRLPPAAGASNLQLPLKSPPVSCCVMLVVYFIYRIYDSFPLQVCVIIKCAFFVALQSYNGLDIFICFRNCFGLMNRECLLLLCVKCLKFEIQE